MELFTLGFPAAFSLTNLLYCFIGVFLGTFVGVLPGIGSLPALALILPISFYLEPTTALVLLSGVYYGGEYGGSTSSILLNLPGSPSNAVTCLDGYPMARQGRAGVALFVCAIGSFVGGSIGILLLITLAQPIVTLALAFGPSEYFATMLFGLIAASTVGREAPMKGVAMVIVGLLLGCIGLDPNTSEPRYALGFLELYDGLSVVVVAIAIFGVAEILSSIEGDTTTAATKVSLRSMVPTREDVRRSTMPVLRGSAIGSVFGALPGTGATIAAFFSYMVEKRLAKDPSRFGNGAVEGIAAPESSNNAAVQTAFIPTLLLGVPGNAVMALMLAAMMIHGVVPGPQIMTDHAALFWGLIASFWIGNVLLLVLNIPMVAIWVKVLAIPYRYLYPTILVLMCIGVYGSGIEVFDIWLMLILGVAGYGMRLLEFPAAPLLLGFILGPLLEEQFRRAMLFGRGDLLWLVHQPIGATILALTGLLIIYLVWSGVAGRRKAFKA
jgi:putative tricarboxylic transport membrane protein